MCLVLARARPNKHAFSTLPGRKKAALHFGVRRGTGAQMDAAEDGKEKKLRRFSEGLSFTLTPAVPFPSSYTMQKRRRRFFSQCAYEMRIRR
jgi:hypothetical protein